MRLDCSNSNIWKEKRNNFLMSSIDQFMKFIRKLASGISSSRKNMRPSKKVQKLKMLKSINSLLLQESTHRLSVLSVQLLKKQKTLKVMPSERSRHPSKRLEKLTPTWLKLTKANSVSLESLQKNLDLIHWFRQIFDMNFLYYYI